MLDDHAPEVWCDIVKTANYSIARCGGAFRKQSPPPLQSIRSPLRIDGCRNVELKRLGAECEDTPRDRECVQGCREATVDAELYYGLLALEPVESGSEAEHAHEG